MDVLKNNKNLYENYTSNIAISQNNLSSQIIWSKKYFEYHILPIIPKDKDINILELGCGWGKYLHILDLNGYTNVEGVDLSKSQIDEAKSSFDLKNVFCADSIEFLTNSKNKYDVIFMFDVLEHLDLDYAIELGKIIESKLNSNGQFIFQSPNGMSLFNPIRYADLTHQRSFTVNSSTQYFNMIGFKNFEFRELGSVPHGVKSTIRKYLWKIISFRIKMFFLVAYGDSMGGIYTANILGIASK